jgi:hypothetical protein
MGNAKHCVLLDQEWEQAAEIMIKFLKKVLPKKEGENS